jgi:beta-lactamase superfamily II metal-dependent hydrolase
MYCNKRIANRPIMSGGFFLERGNEMKRTKLFSIILFVWIILSIIGCGDFNEKETTPANYTANEKAAGTPKVTESSDAAGEMTVHFLDVGEGLSVLVQTKEQNLIYDGGDGQSSSFVVSYLKKQGVKKIDYLISSHYDSDHLSGLIGCLNAFEVDHVIGADYKHDSDLYQSFMDAALEKELSVEHQAVGSSFLFGTSSITFLSPSAIQEESNANSVVIKIQHGDHRFILTGDADIAAELCMCASGIDLDCDVLSIGHHGSASSTSMEFLEKTLPDYSVISCSSNNQYGHPHKDVLDKLSVMETELFRNDLQGTIIATSDGETLSWDQKPCNDYTPGDLLDKGTQSQTKMDTSRKTMDQNLQESTEETVWLSASGEKYHLSPTCGRMNPDTARKVSTEEAQESGYVACNKCF